MAEHVPPGGEEDVLLSLDLLPHVFATLELKHGAAAAVCSTWLRCWIDTDEQRRGLRPAEPPELRLPGMNLQDVEIMAAHPSGETMAIDLEGTGIIIVDQSLQEVRRVTALSPPTEYMCCSEYMCFSEDHLFVCVSGRSDASIISYSTDSFEEVARYTEEELDRCYCVLNGPNGLVYAIACYDDPYEVEQEGVPSRAIVALDAVTLERRLHFGRGVFGIKVAAIAVVGDELYAVDSRGLCIRVFSLAGVYLREIKGDWREPCHLLHHGGRLYLDERRGEDEDWHGADEEDPQTWSADRKAAGKRIFVLTPEGETLQVWNAERTIWGMYIFGRKLLVRVGDQCAAHALIALKGI